AKSVLSRIMEEDRDSVERDNMAEGLGDGVEEGVPRQIGDDGVIDLEQRAVTDRRGPFGRRRGVHRMWALIVRRWERAGLSGGVASGEPRSSWADARHCEAGPVHARLRRQVER